MFADVDLQQRLIKRLRARRIPFSISVNGAVRYFPSAEPSVDACISEIRRSIFRKWQVLTAPREWLQRYPDYMVAHGIPYRREVANGQTWYLLPRANRPHAWKLD